MKETERTTAVALEYNKVDAPKVIATGVDNLAHEILKIAKKNNIPIYENDELVKILAKINIGDEIPESLYQIIAQILAFVFYLKECDQMIQ